PSRLGPVLAQHPKRLRRERAAPLVIVLLYRHGEYCSIRRMTTRTRPIPPAVDRNGRGGRAAVLGSVLAVVVCSAGGVSAQPARTAAPPPDLDAWVARAMQTFEVPGLAIAIVKDDAVALAKGYGVRKLGEPAAVDARTLFGIASNTKVFTA